MRVLLAALAAIHIGPLRIGAQIPSVAKEMPDAEEIAVMAAALEAAYAHATPGWVLVGARTATFECN
jgi:hypothetical protein